MLLKFRSSLAYDVIFVGSKNPLSPVFYASQKVSTMVNRTRRVLRFFRRTVQGTAVHAHRHGLCYDAPAGGSRDGRGDRGPQPELLLDE